MPPGGNSRQLYILGGVTAPGSLCSLQLLLGGEGLGCCRCIKPAELTKVWWGSLSTKPTRLVGVSLCSQAGLELAVILLPQPTHVNHHAQLTCTLDSPLSGHSVGKKPWSLHSSLALQRSFAAPRLLGFSPPQFVLLKHVKQR